MNEYLVELFNWIQTQDSTFNQRYSYEDFENNMQDLQYADEMYQWIASKDATFAKREPISLWTEKIKKKKDFGTSREEALGTGQTTSPSDTSQSTTQTTDQSTTTLDQEYFDAGLTPSQTSGRESWGGLKSLLTQSTARERSQPDYEGWFKIDKPVTPEGGDFSEGQETAQYDEETETYTIDGQEVTQQEFQEYSAAHEEVKKQEDDPFLHSMQAVSQDLMTHEEQYVVPLLNYHFNQYGFTFEEAGGLGDAMTVTAANGESINVNLDLIGGDSLFRDITAIIDVPQWFSGGKKKQRNKLADFLIENKKESRRLKLAEEGYSKLERKILTDKKIDATITLLNKDANYFNKDIESFLRFKTEVDALDAVFGGLTQEQINEPSTRPLYNQYIQKKQQLNTMQAELMVRDSKLKTRGGEIDRVMGEYNQMQTEQGETSAATQNAFWDGVARMGAGGMNAIIDMAVEALPSGGAGEQNFRKMFAGVAEEMYQIPFPGKNDSRTWEEYLEQLTAEQQQEVTDKVQDILKKDLKYNTYDYDDRGVAVKKTAPLGTYYSKESLKQWKELPENMGMIDFQRAGAREVLGSSGATKEYNDLTKQGFWGGAYLGLVESLPAMIGGNNPAGWAQRTAQMYSQVSDHLNEEMENNPQFADISENERQAIMLPIGAVVATLEAIGLRNVLSQKGILNAVLLRSIGKYRNVAQVRGRNFSEVVRNEVDNMVARGVLTVGAAGFAEFETGFAQEIADLGGKYVYNELIKNKDMFVLPETFGDAVLQTLRAGAQEMVGGWIMGVPGAMSNMAASKDFTRMDDGMFEVFEDMANDDKNDGKSSRIYTLWLKDQVNQGKLTLEEAKEQEAMFNEIKGVYSQIPEDYSTQQKKEALGLLLNKQRIEQEIAGKDPSSVTRQMDQLKTIASELASLSYKAYQQNQETTRGRVEEDEITEEDAINQLKEEGVENPTPEQINTKLNELQKRKAEELAKKESASNISPVEEQESQSDPTREGDIGNQNEAETESQDRVQTEEEVDSQELSDFEAMVDPESKSDQDIDSNPTSKKKVFNVENKESDIEVNEVSENLSFTSSPNNRVKGKQSIVEQAKMAARAVAKIFPSLKIVVHRDEDSYTKLDKDNDNAFYQRLDNTIHINLANATGRTVGHEIFHAVLINKLKFNDKLAQAVTKRMVQALVRSRSIPKEVRGELRKFIKNYDSEIQNEERLAEIFGMIADNYTQFDAPTKSKIRKWIEAIAEKLGIEVGQSSQDVINLLNRLAGKIKTGETITESDIAAFDMKTKFNQKQEQGTGGQVGTDININQQRKQKGRKAPPISNDQRPFAKHIKDKSLADFAGRNFVTNMYDFTMSGLTELGNGLSMTLYGGKNYVADMMERAGKNLGDVSNLAAFNTESQAATFIRNVLQGDANLFIPHRGTDQNSWQFQQAIFEGLVNVALDNKILTEQEMKNVFNEVLTNEVGKKAFEQYKKKSGRNDIKSFNDLTIKEIVEGLNIENNFSPNLRKALNDKLSANKAYQEAIGVKNKNEFAGRLEDPANKNSQAFDLIGITEFVPESMVISQPKPGDVDYHPSFGWTIKAKIEGIYQPTEFYQSTEVTNSYTKFNKGSTPATSVKKLVGDTKFKQSNVSSSAGAIPKVGTISVRKQKSAQNLGSNYNMNFKGFMPANIYNIQNLKRAAAELGLTVHAAYIREGYRSGELVGHYFKRNGRFFNPFKTVRKQKSINEIGRESKNIIDIVRLGRMNNIKENTIITYLKGLKYKMSEINPLMKISGYTLENVPKAFGNIAGGMMNGLKLFDKVVAYRNKLMNNNLTPVGKKITNLLSKIDKLKIDLDQPTIFKNKKRVEKINNEIKKIQKQINTLQDKAQKDGKKLYKYTQGQIDEMTVEFLESTPEYQGETFENGFSTQQAQMIAQMKTAFSGTVLQDVGGRIKRAKQILTQRVKGRKELDEVKRDLRNFIRQALPNYVFSRPEVVKLIRSITNANLENIENKKAEVVEFVNKKTNQALTNKIEEILNGKYEDIQAGRPKGYKVSHEVHKRLKGIKAMINEINFNDTTQIDDKVQAILDEIAKLESQTDLTPKDRNSIADLNIVIDFLNAQLSQDVETSKTEALDDVLNNLNSLVETGKTQLQKELFDKHLQYVAEFETLYYDITGLRVKSYIENPDFNELLPESNANPRLIKNPEVEVLLRDTRLISEARKNKVRNRAVQAFRNLGIATRNFIYMNSDLATWMGVIGKMPGDILGNETQKITSVKVNEGTREYKARKMMTTLAINNKLEEVYGKNWQTKAQNDSSIQPTGIFTDSGVELPPLSQNQMAYLVAQYKDPANELSFETKYGKGYKRIMAEMEAKLNDEVKELSRWQVEEFFPSLYEGYNEAYKKIYRTSMPWNQYYAGRIYREGRNPETDIMQLMSSGTNAFKNFAAPASTKVRMNNALAIADMDQMSTLISYVNDMNYFASMGEVINDMSKLFKNKDIKSQIVFNFGKTPYESIMNMITKLGNRGVSNEKSMEWVNNITTAFVIGKLSINPTIFIKQLTSAPAYAAFIGFRNWSKLAAMNATQYSKIWKEISNNSVYIQDRYGESILRTLESYSESNVKSVIPAGAKGRFIDVMMWLVKQGDKGAIVIGGVPNYIHYKNKFKAANPQATEQEAIEHAVRLFERDTKMTQQSSDLQDRDEFQTGAWYARGLNMFQTSIKQYFRQELMAAINIYRKAMSGSKEGKGTYKENARRLMVYHSLLPIAFQYVAAGLPGILAPWDEEDNLDLMRAGVLGNLNAMFILGEIVTYYGDKWTGKPWTGETSGGIPILEVSAKFFKELQKADKYNVTPFDKNGKPRKPEAIAKSKAAKEELYKKAIFDLLNSLGLPTRQIDRLIKNSDKILNGNVSPQEFILLALQYSEYVVESDADRKAKRTKEKKADKLSVEEMKRYNPEAYFRYKQQQDAIRNSPQYRERQRLKDLEKQRRQQYLNQRYNN